jgi:large subunit ribosomal protein L24
MAVDKSVNRTRLKVNDEVVVISGKNKDSKGKIMAMNLETGRIVVQGVNLRRQFTRPTQENPQGGTIEREMPIHISNVMYWDSKAKKPSRIGVKKDANGVKLRIAKASDRTID